MAKKEISESIESIREECDKIEKEIKPKKGEVYGDPTVNLS